MMVKSKHLKRILFFIIFDIFISLGTLFLAYNLRFNFYIDEAYLKNFFLIFVLLTTLKIMAFAYFKMYHRTWSLMSLFELKKLFYGHFIAYSAFVMLYYLIPEAFTPFPRSVLMIDFALSFLLLGTLRMSKRILKERQGGIGKVRTLVIGVSSLSQTLLKGDNNLHIVAIVDNEESVVDSYLGDIKVTAFSTIEESIQKQKIETVIFSKELDRDELNALYSKIYALGVLDIRLLSLRQREVELKAISVEDLLSRQPKDLDRISIANFIAGKVVLITGAGGSIGSELSRQVALFGAKKIILLDHSEFNLYQISEELLKENIVSVLMNIQNKERLETVLAEHLPDVVFHAAAYKHVPLCEENVKSAVENNVFGTKNIIDVSIRYGVQKFLLISTDKAVRPTNVMGATKRVCELYAHAVPSGDTEIVAVRFGNVLGSSGSVIPKFKAQIEKGENITVTHPEITRYFMLIPEACQLVLQAASIAKGGELFILDMGEPIKIVDLATRMIELANKPNIQIEFTGLRQGEKLYEELLINEASLKTEYNSILVAEDKAVDYEKLLEQLKALRIGNYIYHLKEIVPEFVTTRE